MAGRSDQRAADRADAAATRLVADAPGGRRRADAVVGDAHHDHRRPHRDSLPRVRVARVPGGVSRLEAAADGDDRGLHRSPRARPVVARQRLRHREPRVVAVPRARRLGRVRERRPRVRVPAPGRRDARRRRSSSRARGHRRDPGVPGPPAHRRPRGQHRALPFVGRAHRRDSVRVEHRDAQADLRRAAARPASSSARPARSTTTWCARRSTPTTSTRSGSSTRRSRPACGKASTSITGWSRALARSCTCGCSRVRSTAASCAGCGSTSPVRSSSSSSSSRPRSSSPSAGSPPASRTRSTRRSSSSATASSSCATPSATSSASSTRYRAVGRAVVAGAPSTELASRAQAAEVEVDLPFLFEQFPGALDRAMDGPRPRHHDRALDEGVRTPRRQRHGRDRPQHRDRQHAGDRPQRVQVRRRHRDPLRRAAADRVQARRDQPGDPQHRRQRRARDRGHRGPKQRAGRSRSRPAATTTTSS